VVATPDLSPDKRVKSAGVKKVGVPDISSVVTAPTPEGSKDRISTLLTAHIKKISFTGIRSPNNSHRPSVNAPPVHTPADQGANISSPAPSTAVNSSPNVHKIQGEELKATASKIMSPGSGIIRNWLPSDEDRVTNEMKKVITSSKTSVGPDIDSILSLIGSWLFEAALCSKKGFSLGRAEALGCLARLFCGRNYRSGLKAEYCMQFYSVIATVLNEEVTKD
jgi:hypothetical protein